MKKPRHQKMREAEKRFARQAYSVLVWGSGNLGSGRVLRHLHAAYLCTSNEYRVAGIRSLSEIFGIM